MKNKRVGKANSVMELLNRLDGSIAIDGLPGLPVHFAKRILYAVNHSFPFSSNGYAVRTHGTSAALVKASFEVITVSRRVSQRQQGHLSEVDNVPTRLLDGVRYMHLASTVLPGATSCLHFEQSAAAMIELVQVLKPSVLMAASNWENALPSALAARELGIPFFYEVRGFWEISHAARDEQWAQSADFQNEVAAETALAKVAQRVFTINSFMRDELVSRGVPKDRIELVPNGFTASPDPLLGDPEIRQTLLQKARHWVGYVGSFSPYEGLLDLLIAVSVLRSQGMDVGLLLVGSSQSSGFDIGSNTLCAVSQDLEQKARQLGMSEALVMPGRLAREEVTAYYPSLDVVVIPRKPVDVSELVSPIKPIEAASYGKRVLMSDVAPLAELAELYPNFFYFKKGNVQSLTDCLRELLQNPPPELPCHPGLESRTWANCVMPMVKAFKAVSSFGVRAR